MVDYNTHQVFRWDTGAERVSFHEPVSQLDTTATVVVLFASRKPGRVQADSISIQPVYDFVRTTLDPSAHSSKFTLCTFPLLPSSHSRLSPRPYLQYQLHLQTHRLPLPPTHHDKTDPQGNHPGSHIPNTHPHPPFLPPPKTSPNQHIATARS